MHKKAVKVFQRLSTICGLLAFAFQFPFQVIMWEQKFSRKKCDKEILFYFSVE